jgi:hypothetical protein
MIIGPRITVTIAISAAVACGLLALAKRAIDVTPAGTLVVRIYPPYANEAAMAWRAPHVLPFDKEALSRYPADDPAVVEGHSPVMIYEDGKPLGPAHSNFADISKLGHGRFSWWTGQGFIFSTSDGSDPNDNGRHYWAVVP